MDVPADRRARPLIEVDSISFTYVLEPQLGQRREQEGDTEANVPEREGNDRQDRATRTAPSCSERPQHGIQRGGQVVDRGNTARSGSETVPSRTATTASTSTTSASVAVTGSAGRPV